MIGDPLKFMKELDIKVIFAIYIFLPFKDFKQIILNQWFKKYSNLKEEFFKYPI